MSGRGSWEVAAPTQGSGVVLLKKPRLSLVYEVPRMDQCPYLLATLSWNRMRYVANRSDLSAFLTAPVYHDDPESFHMYSRGVV
jgi:hypothetical protein